MATSKKPMSANAARGAASGRPNGNRQSTNAQDLAVRRYKALEMRVAGYTYREIVAAIGVNQTTILADIDWCLREREAGNIIKLRAIEEARLDDCIRAAYEVLEANRKTELALKAVDRIDRLVGRRAALLGLNAPVELNVMAHEKTQADLELEELLREAHARNKITHEQIVAQVTGDADPAPAG